MKFYKVTGTDKSKGYRVSISQPNLTKLQAERMANNLMDNPYFKDVLIEKSEMK